MKPIRTSYLIATILIGLCACKREVAIPEVEARRFAQEALARYCKSEKLSPQKFILQEIGPSGDTPWMLVYVSSGISPAQEVVVSINKYGGLEVSRDIKSD